MENNIMDTEKINKIPKT